jgi:hypothetical protein
MVNSFVEDKNEFICPVLKVYKFKVNEPNPPALNDILLIDPFQVKDYVFLTYHSDEINWKYRLDIKLTTARILSDIFISTRLKTPDNKWHHSCSYQYYNDYLVAYPECDFIKFITEFKVTE